ncbi:MAG: DUF2314 domain-containing protein [Phycisphaerae bacterium]|jgi:uncharacterized protein YegJ (DUF2314 family)|nr:DUF2314 domain-containing protein [Phycisphaerae bacterium]
MKYRSYLQCVLTCALVAASDCEDRKDDGVVRRDGEPDFVTQYDEKAMTDAVAKAKATWKEFSAALARPAPGMTNFTVKRGFLVDDDPEGEHIWLSNVSFDGEKFRGTVDNNPVSTKEVKFGQIVDVRPEELTDWMFVENGILRGGYTLRVLIMQESPEDRKKLLKTLGFRLE